MSPAVFKAPPERTRHPQSLQLAEAPLGGLWPGQREAEAEMLTPGLPMPPVLWPRCVLEQRLRLEAGCARAAILQGEVTGRAGMASCSMWALHGALFCPIFRHLPSRPTPLVLCSGSPVPSPHLSPSPSLRWGWGWYGSVARHRRTNGAHCASYSPGLSGPQFPSCTQHHGAAFLRVSWEGLGHTGQRALIQS